MANTVQDLKHSASRANDKCRRLFAEVNDIPSTLHFGHKMTLEYFIREAERALAQLRGDLEATVHVKE